MTLSSPKIDPSCASTFGRVTPRPSQRIGIVNDYVRIPYANGSSFASQFLYRELSRRGHEVTVIGPRDPGARPEEMPERYVCLSSLPMRNQPGLYIPLPDRRGLRAIEELSLDAIIAQTGSALMTAASWLRYKRRVPALCVNTVHLESVYDAVLPQRLHDSEPVQRVFRDMLVPWLLSHTVRAYNETDGLVVLAEGLRDYWRALGVTVPIHVIPRAVDPTIFAGPAGADPFDARATKGLRLLVVCRHTREKELERLLRIFAQRVAPVLRGVTLTLIGDGPDHQGLIDLTQELGIADSTFFTGEIPLTEVRRYYRHADLFVYTSLSETYGQVVSEAMWSRLPVVAFDDQKGVRQQVQHERDGYLIAPGPDRELADDSFAEAVLTLLVNDGLRAAIGEAAERSARLRGDPERCLECWQEALACARDHRDRTLPSARPLAALGPLTQWRTIHSLMLLFGLLPRPGAHPIEASQPSWAGQTISDAAAAALLDRAQGALA